MHPPPYRKLHDASAKAGQAVTRWLKTPKAARHLRIGAGTLTKLRVYGGGPRFAKLGRTVIYAVEDLDAWAATRKVGSTSERGA